MIRRCAGLRVDALLPDRVVGQPIELNVDSGERAPQPPPPVIGGRKPVIFYAFPVLRAVRSAVPGATGAVRLAPGVKCPFGVRVQWSIGARIAPVCRALREHRPLGESVPLRGSGP